jgi:hypothetical protein
MHIPDQLVVFVMRFASWFVLVPFIVSVFWWFRKTEKRYEQKMIAAYILLAVLGEIISRTIGAYRLNNLPVLHVYTLMQFLLVALLYRPFMMKPVTPSVWSIVTIVFLLGSIINSLFVQSIWSFNGFARAAESFIIVLFAIWYFRKLLFSDAAAVPLQEVPMFWISTALLFYFSGCFFVFLLSGYVLDISSKVFSISWAFHDLILIIHYIFITAALWPTRQPTPSMSPFSQAR